MPFKTIEDAIQIANDTEYGLYGIIWTQNLTDAMTLSRNVRAGVITVNNFGPPSVIQPFGGVKQSGHGREMGLDGFLTYVTQKTIILNA